MIGYIAGGCIAIYIVAFLLRWLVKLYTKVSGRGIASYKVRYTTIGIATIIAFIVSAFGEGGFNSPDYSYWWVFLISGLIVFAGSLGYSYKEWKEDQHEDEAGEAEDVISNSPEGAPAGGRLEEELSSYPVEEKSEDVQWRAIVWPGILGTTIGFIGAAAIVGFVAIVVDESILSGDGPLVTVIGVIIAIVMWFGEGFMTAITNPYYIGGLVIGIGTGWILRGAAKT